MIVIDSDRFSWQTCWNTAGSGYIDISLDTCNHWSCRQAINFKVLRYSKAIAVCNELLINCVIRPKYICQRGQIHFWFNCQSVSQEFSNKYLMVKLHVQKPKFNTELGPIKCVTITKFRHTPAVTCNSNYFVRYFALRRKSIIKGQKLTSLLKP